MAKFHSKENIHTTQIVLKVQNIKKSTEFYRNILGFKILEDKGNEVTLTADGNTKIVSLISPSGVTAKLPRRTGLYHFALLLPDSIQLGLFLKHIRDKAYPIIGGSNHGVSEAIYLEDPDDNGIEIYADIDSRLWDWEGDKVNMVTLPLDFNRLVANTQDAKWQGLPPETIIGHIHLHVSDLEEAKEFYVKGMGLDVVAEVPKSAIFLSSGGYHHHIALNVWNGVGAQSLPENSVGMKFYTVTFPDEIIRKKRINGIEKLGYNIIKNNDGIFVKDPSDNIIRLVV